MQEKCKKEKSIELVLSPKVHNESALFAKNKAMSAYKNKNPYEIALFAKKTTNTYKKDNQQLRTWIKLMNKRIPWNISSNNQLLHDS